MPRGSKTCSKCQTITGPRAFKCPNCGEHFKIKGEVITRSPKSGYIKKEDKQVLDCGLKVESFFNEIDYSKDPTNLNCFDGNARCWESPDGIYRLRKAKTFMGVDSFEGRYYHLLRRNHCGDIVQWELISRHKSMIASLSTFEKVLKGEKIVKDPGRRKRSLKKFLKKAAKV